MTKPERAGDAPIGVDVQGPNLEKLAEAMHSQYAKAQTVADFTELLKPLANLAGPLLIEYVSEIDA